MARRTFLGRLARQGFHFLPSKRLPKKDYRPRIESLDSRLLLSTFTVTNSGDSGPGTLREVITQSNADSGQPNSIHFNLDATQRTIALATPLPVVTTPVTIDGTSDPAAPDVALSGSAGAADGLTIQSANSTVKGLDFRSFSGTALNLQGNSIVVQGNKFGTRATARPPRPTGPRSGSRGRTRRSAVRIPARAT